MPLPDEVDAISDDHPGGERAGDSRPAAASHVHAVGSLVVDAGKGVAMRDGRRLRLLPREFALLVYLIRHANRIVSRQAIALDVWGDEMATWTNVITVNINGLRKEIEREGLPTLLHTVRGEGYCLGDLSGD